MAEFTANAVQLVAANQNILFDSTPVSGPKCVVHRDGSGLATLRGITNNCRARFLVLFSGNIAAVSSAGEITAAIAINGEPLGSSTMSVTPTNTGYYYNIASSTYVDVPKGCCITIAVENTSTQPINVKNANLIVARVA